MSLVVIRYEIKALLLLLLLQLGQNPSGGWVCSSVWEQHCGKYHICREKMHLSRAKPGNPASRPILYTYVRRPTHARTHPIYGTTMHSDCKI